MKTCPLDSETLKMIIARIYIRYIHLHYIDIHDECFVNLCHFFVHSFFFQVFNTTFQAGVLFLILIIGVYLRYNFSTGLKCNKLKCSLDVLACIVNAKIKCEVRKDPNKDPNQVFCLPNVSFVHYRKCAS
jgi:hypothetical protein